jgi:hypothetical protein
MNTIGQIISNAVDLAGGAYIANVIDIGQVTLYALNVISDMELELDNSARGQNARKETVTFAADTNEGTLEFLPKFARYRDTSISGAYRRWNILDIVSDIEDLTEYENQGRFAMLIEQANLVVDTLEFPYRLSFIPQIALEVELYGSREAVIEGLEGETGINTDYSHYAATKVALIVLDDLLLMDANKYMAFVNNRKQMMALRLRNLEHRWNVYRTNADINLADNQAKPYDPIDDDNFGLGRFETWR